MINLGNSLVEQEKIEKLINALRSTENMEGDVAEVGVYKGGTALEIVKNTSSNVFLFDTFDGMPYFSEDLDNRWKLGSFNDVNYSDVSNLFVNYNNVKIYKGIFPLETSSFVENNKFKFVHLDVDNYYSFKECLNFFYKRMVVNGIMIFDDYDCECCPGANAAIDEFFKEKEEKIVTDVIAYIVKK
jgi:O-methyltransferase